MERFSSESRAEVVVESLDSRESFQEPSAAEKSTESLLESPPESIREGAAEPRKEVAAEPMRERRESAGMRSDGGSVDEPNSPDFQGPEPGLEGASERARKEAVQRSAPTVTSVAPATVCGLGTVTIVAKGSGFVPQTQARFQTVPLPTVVKSSRELSFRMDLSIVPTGSYKVEFCNPPNDCSKEFGIQVLHPSNCP